MRKIFLAANTPNGFKECFGSMLKGKYVYVIKGGSGVGKSTFMRRMLSVDNDSDSVAVPCSSDVHSLDMAVLPSRNIAIVDGTNPHVVEAVPYGIGGEIIDLGQFIDKSRLRQFDDEINAKTQQKSVLYTIMYAHLQRARLNVDNVDTMYSECVKDTHSIVKDIIDTFIIGSSEAESPLRCYGEYFNENGYICDESVVNNRVVVKVKSPCKLISARIIDAVAAFMESYGIIFERHFSALLDGHLMGVALRDVVITAADIDSDYEYVLDEYIDNDKLRRYLLHLIEERSAYASAIARASEYFLDAKLCHQSLEECYKQAMQYDKLEKFKDKFINKIFDK